MIKNIFSILLVLTVTLFAETDLRLNHYPKAIEWLQDADTNGESAYNIGVIYHQKIKDNDKAIEWYTKAYNMDDKGAAGSAANNLGYIYEDIKNNHEAVKFYTKAYAMGNMGGANNLGYFYEQKLKDKINATLWYKKAASKGYEKSIKNLALLNRDQEKKIEGAAWYLALIDLKYSKEKVFSYLKTKWNLTDEEIKKAYKLQKTLDIPKHYYDPEFEEKTVTQKPGRR